MRKVFFSMLFTFSISSIQAQNITVQNISSNKSVVQVSDKESVRISFDNYFRAEAETFNLVNYYIYADSLNQNKIGKYSKNRLKFNDGRHYKYKLNKKNNNILVYDKEKNIVFNGKLIYDENFGYLKSIEVLKNETDTKIVEAWATLSTIHKIYSNESKDLKDNFLLGALIGAGLGVGGALF